MIIKSPRPAVWNPGINALLAAPLLLSLRRNMLINRNEMASSFNPSQTSLMTPFSKFSPNLDACSAPGAYLLVRNS